MPRLRADLWCAAFIRRHNDLGHVCVLSRKGDPVAGQIWVEIDHLNGTASLYTPAPSSLIEEGGGRQFQQRYAGAEPSKVRERIAREVEFDPDVWVITLEMRSGDPGLPLVQGA